MTPDNCQCPGCQDWRSLRAVVREYREPTTPSNERIPPAVEKPRDGRGKGGRNAA